MSVVLVAVGGTALLGAYSADKASDAATASTNKGLKQSAALSDQSRNDAMTLYNQGRQSARTGLTSAFDFYKKAASSRYQPMILGNVAAQKAIGQGAMQANNAILGNPVDMSFAQPQQITPDMSFLQNAQLPVMDQNIAVGGIPVEQQPQALHNAAQQTLNNYRGGLGRQAVK